MSKVSINLGGGLWLIAQIVLLVLYYGKFAPDLPWWVVWFPALVTVGITVVIILALILMLIFMVIMALFGDN